MEDAASGFTAGQRPEARPGRRDLQKTGPPSVRALTSNESVTPAERPCLIALEYCKEFNLTVR